MSNSIKLDPTKNYDLDQGVTYLRAGGLIDVAVDVVTAEDGSVVVDIRLYGAPMMKPLLGEVSASAGEDREDRR